MVLLTILFNLLWFEILLCIVDYATDALNILAQWSKLGSDLKGSRRQKCISSCISLDTGYNDITSRRIPHPPKRFPCLIDRHDDLIDFKSQKYTANKFY